MKKAADYLSSREKNSFETGIADAMKVICAMIAISSADAISSVDANGLVDAIADRVNSEPIRISSPKQLPFTAVDAIADRVNSEPNPKPFTKSKNPINRGHKPKMKDKILLVARVIRDAISDRLHRA